MVFNSYEFLLFFPVVSLLYFVFPHKFRWVVLLTSSLFFYFYFEPIYVLILIGVVLNSYLAGLLMRNASGQKVKRILLWSGIAINIAVLFFFKYFDFFSSTVGSVAEWRGHSNPFPLLNLLLPLGISFYTFQAIAYLTDVYRGTVVAEKRIHIFSTYMVFFPQLVAGPIERASNLLPQFEFRHKADSVRIFNGLKLMLWGFFQKIVIADRLAVISDSVYGNLDAQNSYTIMIGTVVFAFQVYCDFSGYTDIARGAAQVLGFSLMENFKKPFSSQSISEFWRRWHISLSSWVNDYIYNPVSFNRRYWGTGGAIYAVVLTFFLLGLWHGASWNFAIFGILHGLAICYEILTRPIRKKLFSHFPAFIVRVIGISTTFLFYCFGGIFFRGETFGESINAIRILFGNMVTHTGSALTMGQHVKATLGVSIQELVFSLLLVVFIFVFDNRSTDKGMIEILNSKRRFGRWIILGVMMAAIMLFGIFGHSQFIYFQF